MFSTAEMYHRLLLLFHCSTYVSIYTAQKTQQTAAFRILINRNTSTEIVEHTTVMSANIEEFHASIATKYHFLALHRDTEMNAFGTLNSINGIRIL